MTISPLVVGMRPDTSIISVLFPHPDGPTIETNSPAAMSKETLSSAFSAARVREENTFSTPTIRTKGSAPTTANSLLAWPVVRISASVPNPKTRSLAFQQLLSHERPSHFAAALDDVAPERLQPYRFMYRGRADDHEV